MNDDFGTIITKLSTHETQLKKELLEATREVKEITDRLTQVQSALAALGGKTKGKASRVAAPPRKNSADLDMIQQIVTRVLSEHDRLSFDALLRHVKSELLARGFSRVGAKTMLVKVTKTSPVTVHPDQTVSAT